MTTFVLKIGGTSLRDAAAFKQIGLLIKSEPQYRVLVPSAPASKEDRMTELLASLEHSEERWVVYGKIEDWLLGIIRGRGYGTVLANEISTDITELSSYIEANGSKTCWSYVKSRGEYWSGKLLSEETGLPFIDSKDLIKFKRNAEYDDRATRHACARYPFPERFVMPGFYGADCTGRIHLFPRNGSDISAAIITVRIKADELHIGRRGVPGIYAMNPDLYDHGAGLLKEIPFLSHAHARELTYRSDSALHPLALVQLAETGTEVRVFDLDRPRDPGTRIVRTGDKRLPKRYHVLGIAERTGFTVFTLSRVGLNERSDFSDLVSSVLGTYRIGFEHQTSGVDHVSIAIRNSAVDGRQREIADSFEATCHTAVSYVQEEASICIVGHMLGSMPEKLGLLLVALGTDTGPSAEAPGTGVTVTFLSQTNAGTSIVIGVPSNVSKKAVNRLYRATIGRR